MKRLLFLLASLVVAAGASCAAEPADPASSEVRLVDLGLPLDGVVDESVWRAAPEGCEGRLHRKDLVEHVSRAENAPGLGVVVDQDGDALCVDSLESIAIELMKLQGDPSPDPMYPKLL